ncbi:hypothetical protein [Arsenophonus sp. PmNCSU2021_1]|uniref:hypothetical protein n=1 Tax=Arsenophonus sp. PmNCSU2021_1 TaxID=3118989 RepID=UPI002FF3ACFE
MFKHELGQVVQITISGEEGRIKGRAEYTNMSNKYYFHHLTADGYAFDRWFDESDLSPAKPV